MYAFYCIGKSIKNIDKITESSLLPKYPEIDWKGIKGFRNIISHHYFNIYAEEVYWICKNQIKPLSDTITKIIHELESANK